MVWSLSVELFAPLTRDPKCKHFTTKNPTKCFDSVVLVPASPFSLGPAFYENAEKANLWGWVLPEGSAIPGSREEEKQFIKESDQRAEY